MFKKTHKHFFKRNKGFFLKNLQKQKGIWFHVAGIIAIVWFAIRVLPRPDRLRYPCQQIGISVALGYIAFWSIVWSAIFHGMAFWFKQVRFKTSVVAPVILISFVMVFSVTSNVFAENYIVQNNDINGVTFWEPIPNEPIGTPYGYKPGRVVWGWNPNATENQLSGRWWENENNDQTVIDELFSSCIKQLGDEDVDFSAWDNLFRYFNIEHGFGDVGYQAGEKIAIKINLNNVGSYTEQDNDRDASPQVTKSLLRQLVNVVGVAQEDITIYESSRKMPDWYYYRVYYQEYPADPLVPEFPDVNYVDNNGGATGRNKVISSNVRVYFAAGSCDYRTLPTVVSEADYLINMPLLKRHPINTGITLSGKNFFGTWIEGVSAVHDYHYLSFTIGNPTPQTDLFAHKDLGGKVVLNVGDGLFPTKNDHRVIGKFQMYPFNNDWTNSLFLSQDPVAIDSVMYDFLHTEGTNPCEGSQNYLHQSAVPNSNTYDPEDDGTFLSDSLGVHEHWNKDEDIFSPDRYLGPQEDGIDYIAISGEEFSCDAGGPYTGLINVPIQFHGTVSQGTPPYDWFWTFGDGEVSYEQNPTHSYLIADTYSIQLFVTDDEGEFAEDQTTAQIYEQFPPLTPKITGETNGKIGEEYLYIINEAVDPEEDDIWVYWDWGDGTFTDWDGPYFSGLQVSETHIWDEKGSYIIKAKLRDEHGAESDWGTLDISIPRIKSTYYKQLSNLLNFPNSLQQILKIISIIINT